ncbi:MAG: 2-amino-4-hydroxy-6-hydroxymethyldihydropteridine diphosphokinase [Rhodothermales bacterium]
MGTRCERAEIGGWLYFGQWARLIVGQSAAHAGAAPSGRRSARKKWTARMGSGPAPVGDVVVYLGVGSNLGDREANLAFAVRSLDGHTSIRVRRTSSVYESEAHVIEPGVEGPPFLNAVIEIATSLSALQLLYFCRRIEIQTGRPAEHEKWGPRTLDIDVLLYGTMKLATPSLLLPHPRMAERRFVLEPLKELAPKLFVPKPFDATVDELLADCADVHRIRRVNSRPLTGLVSESDLF